MNESLAKVFGNRLRTARLYRHIESQSELAAAVGCSKQSISLYENGMRVPDCELLRRFSDLLNVSADYLIGKTGCMEARNESFAQIGLSDDALESLKGLFQQQVALETRGAENPPTLALINALLEQASVEAGRYAVLAEVCDYAALDALPPVELSITARREGEKAPAAPIGGAQLRAVDGGELLKLAYERDILHKLKEAAQWVMQAATTPE